MLPLLILLLSGERLLHCFERKGVGGMRNLVGRLG
jgi:hypothetical protein